MMRNRYLEGETLFQAAEARFTGYEPSSFPLTAASVNLRRLWMRRWREGSFSRRPDTLTQLETLLPSFQQAKNMQECAMCLLMIAEADRGAGKEAQDIFKMMEGSLADFQALGDEFYMAWALHFMGRLSMTLSGVQTAFDLQQRSLVLRQRCADLNGVIYSLYNLSTDLLHMGKLEQSTQMAREMVDLSLQMGERSGELMANGTLSLVAWLQGERDRALDLNDHVLMLSEAINHPLGRTHGVVVQGLLALIQDPVQTEALTPWVSRWSSWMDRVTGQKIMWNAGYSKPSSKCRLMVRRETTMLL